MREDMETMWQAMKGSHYQRVSQKLAQAIHQTQDLQEALSAALGTVVKAIHAQTGTLWLYERFGNGRIYAKAVYGGADLSGVSLLPGEGIAGQVTATGLPVIIKDCQADPRWAGRVDEKTGFKTESMICVPLVLDDQCFGSIQIINQKDGVFFDEKDLSFAAQLASEVAKLLNEKGLLEGYLPPEQAPLGLTVEELLFCSPREMERLLYKMPAFAMLPHRRQQEALRLCKQLRDCFSK